MTPAAAGGGLGAAGLGISPPLGGVWRHPKPRSPSGTNARPGCFLPMSGGTASAWPGCFAGQNDVSHHIQVGNFLLAGVERDTGLGSPSAIAGTPRRHEAYWSHLSRW